MKYLFGTIILFLMLAGGCGTSEMSSDDYGPDQTFSMLNDYGRWIFVPGLGRVWKPAEPVEWQPYSDGHWIWTNSGWMWISEEQFGWIVYHYGYWNFDDQYGWIWVPSYDWVPARVDWFYQDGYIGWAPRPSRYVAQRDVYYENHVANVFVFVTQENFVVDNVVRYKTRSSNIDIRIIRNRSGDRAPDVRDVEHVTNRQIRTIQINQDKVQAGNRQLIRARVEEDRPDRNNNVRNSTDRSNEAPLAPPINNLPPPTRTVNPPGRSGEVSPTPPDRKSPPPIKTINPPDRNGNNNINNKPENSAPGKGNTIRILRNQNPRNQDSTKVRKPPVKRQSPKGQKENAKRDTTEQRRGR